MAAGSAVVAHTLTRPAQRRMHSIRRSFSFRIRRPHRSDDFTHAHTERTHTHSLEARTLQLQLHLYSRVLLLLLLAGPAAPFTPSALCTAAAGE